MDASSVSLLSSKYMLTSKCLGALVAFLNASLVSDYHLRREP